MSQQDTGATAQTRAVAERSGEESRQVSEQASDKVREAGGQAKEKARGTLREQVDQRSRQAGDQLGSTAGDVRAVGDQLRERGNEPAARLADQAAHHTERLASYLSNSSADRILADAEDYARRQPWAVALGGLALGFAASRLLRASSQQRSAGRGRSGPPPTAWQQPPTPASRPGQAWQESPTPPSGPGPVPGWQEPPTRLTDEEAW
jgi:hypothetical protein